MYRWYLVNALSFIALEGWPRVYQQIKQINEMWWWRGAGCARGVRSTANWQLEDSLDPRLTGRENMSRRCVVESGFTEEEEKEEREEREVLVSLVKAARELEDISSRVSSPVKQSKRKQRLIGSTN